MLAVAFDTGGPAAVEKFVRPPEPIVVPPPMRAIMGWTEEQYDRAAAPTYPCLIDEQHVVAELYDMANVPLAVWIDEAGVIVRSAEPAGATDGFRQMDRTTFTLPVAVAEAGRAARAAYVGAVRDWVENGSASRYVLSPAALAERIGEMSDEEARAAAAFRLGCYLRENGRADSAARWFAQAAKLAPDRWNYFRQALDLNEKGSASGPLFQAAVKELGERSYYPSVKFQLR
jgi:hypothetical protein